MSEIRVSNNWGGFACSQDRATGAVAEVLSGCLLRWQGRLVCAHRAVTQGKYFGDHSQRYVRHGAHSLVFQTQQLHRCEPSSSVLGQAVTVAVALANGLHGANASHGHRHLGDLTAATCKHHCEASAVLSYYYIYPGSHNMRETTK